jgi:hypothetical protein
MIETWGMRDADRKDIRIGDMVQVVAWGLGGANKRDVGKVGKVVDNGSAERAVIMFPGETSQRRIAGRVLRIVEACPATPVGFPQWRCKLPPGHEGEHRRGPAHWPNTLDIEPNA